MFTYDRIRNGLLVALVVALIALFFPTPSECIITKADGTAYRVSAWATVVLLLDHSNTPIRLLKGKEVTEESIIKAYEAVGFTHVKVAKIMD